MLAQVEMLIQAITHQVPAETQTQVVTLAQVETQTQVVKLAQAETQTQVVKLAQAEMLTHQIPAEMLTQVITHQVPVEMQLQVMTLEQAEMRIQAIILQAHLIIQVVIQQAVTMHQEADARTQHLEIQQVTEII